MSVNPEKRQGCGPFPLRVLLFSGKRKCGKDFITDLLFERIGSSKAAIIKISSPIKSHWAEAEGLNLQQLMSAETYKERYRQEMIAWSEAIRKDEPGYFCSKAVAMNNAGEKPIWIVSDIRRKTDIAWFLQEYGDAVRTVRVVTDEDVRIKRGYIFTQGVDDKASECDLDEVTDWHWKIHNNGDSDELEKSIQSLLSDIEMVLQ